MSELCAARPHRLYLCHMAQFLLTVAFVIIPWFPLTGMAVHCWAGGDVGKRDGYRFLGMVACVVAATLVWQWMWFEAGRIVR